MKKLMNYQIVDSMIKVSVIIPVYNAEKYLEESLDSIFNQTLEDIEIICVDDGSTDNSWKMLNEFASNHKNMKIFHQTNCQFPIRCI